MGHVASGGDYDFQDKLNRLVPHARVSLVPWLRGVSR